MCAAPGQRLAFEISGRRGLTDPHNSGDGPLSHNIARVTSLLIPYIHGAKILVGAMLAVTAVSWLRKLLDLEMHVGWKAGCGRTV